ncbi:MAG: LysE family transporter [Prevotella sp.]|nr:LysE family transporter [Prevotella sp.]
MPEILFPVDIIELILKGMLIGVIASAPMGPVGVLCVQRTLNKGRWPGFATGIGAALSDIIYALLTGLGLSFLQDFITQPVTLYILKVAGSTILLVFGIVCFRSKPRHVELINRQNLSFFYNAHTAFWLTFANPLIILLFVAIMAQLTFVVSGHPLEMGIGYVSIMIGALLWWFGLTWVIDKVRGRFSEDGIVIINRIIGSVVIIVSLVFLVGTIFNLYSLKWY